AEVANLTFREVADNGEEPGPANQRLTFRTLAVDQQYSGSTEPYQYDGSPDIYGADIILNTTGMEKRVAQGGYFDWTFYVTLHEILHAVGLSHPGDYNGAGFNYQDDADFRQDTRQYTVMSYWDAANAGADHFIGSTQYVAQTPLLYDILALQRLYGANMTTRAGDTVYGFNSNTGSSPFDFSVNPAPVLAIWDGGGRDRLDLSGWSDSSVIDLREGTFSSGGGLTGNIAIAFGAVIEEAVGGAGNDTLTGNAAANLLDGGAGADVMTGGGGNDVFIVDQAGDLVSEAAGGGTDTVRAGVSFTLGAEIENLILEGSGAINGTGNGLANTITGNAAANRIDGGAGGDLMRGGDGNDIYYVQSAADVVLETAASHGADRVISTVSYTLGRYVEHLSLAGSAAINGAGNGLANAIVGNGGANVIKGGAGADSLDGGGGNDRIYGGTGNDVLKGGTGMDGFYFDTPLNAGSNVGRILDFIRADDTIFLDRDVFRGIAADGALNAAAFRAGTAARDASDRIVYDQQSGSIYYDPDGTGAAAQVLFAMVTPNRYLTPADFVAFI
ncbi:MAG TPA: M10 family metallopeptidase C-terminal domain-containing protein, partial [Allosphingosinicella sp.]|nr:M10 family metallopeptidase C-terminal domain-containing protein [Allosphingosinicella sp.]